MKLLAAILLSIFIVIPFYVIVCMMYPDLSDVKIHLIGALSFALIFSSIRTLSGSYDKKSEPLNE